MPSDHGYGRPELLLVVTTDASDSDNMAAVPSAPRLDAQSPADLLACAGDDLGGPVALDARAHPSRLSVAQTVRDLVGLERSTGDLQTSVLTLGLAGL